MHVIVIGAGFAGINCVRDLSDRPNLRVTLIDRANYHLFLPLLYQVAIAGLEAPQIAEPARAILQSVPNARFLLGTVRAVDMKRKILRVDDRSFRYDYLVVATGSETVYLGVEGAREHAYGLKRLGEAMDIRDQVLSACEEAARTRDPERRKHLLTFIIVGGGATGVELAGALAELRKRVIPRDYPEIEPEEFRVVMVESSAHPLAAMPEDLSMYAERILSDHFGVEFINNARVSRVRPDGVEIEGGGFVAGYTTIWTAGVQGASFNGLPEGGRGGRIATTPALNLDDHPEVFILGDLNGLEDPQTGRPYPQLAPMAIQQGQTAARNIKALIDGRPLSAFEYDDKGTMVTLGRNKGVAIVYGRKLRGFPAWVAWLAVHIVQLIGFRNRVFVLMSWIYSYFTYDFAVRIMHRRRRFPAPEGD